MKMNKEKQILNINLLATDNILELDVLKTMILRNEHGGSLRIDLMSLNDFLSYYNIFYVDESIFGLNVNVFGRFSDDLFFDGLLKAIKKDYKKNKYNFIKLEEDPAHYNWDGVLIIGQNALDCQDDKNIYYVVSSYT